MEASEKSEIKDKAQEISELMKGDTESLFKALEVAESVEDEKMRLRLIGEVLSRLTLMLEEEGTPEAIETSESLKRRYFNKNSTEAE